ncbi:hypothetical protein SH2C18_30100 [Clostridium sediminicola]|uniref:diguanylate cyclase n=1 Tax=Clostridium sediminicola TaxID=3114879 RepID=UPI0031F2067B
MKSNELNESNNKLDELLNYVETPYIIFDTNYYIMYYNPAAKNIISEDNLISSMINKAYWPIIKNGVENKFPFIISEKRRLNKTVLSTSTSSYKLVVKPIKESQFLMECIEINAVKRSNTFLIKKVKDFVMKSTILEKLLAIKSKDIDIKNISAIEILELFEEQLSIQFEIDDAISDIIVPIISMNASIHDVADIMLAKLKQLTNCDIGIIISRDFTNKEFKIIEKFDSINIFPKLATSQQICNHFMSFNDACFYNNLKEVATLSGLDKTFNNKIKNILLTPIWDKDSKIGELVLFNCENSFKSHHLEIAKRLVQLYSLSYQRGRSIYNLEISASKDVLTNCFNRRAGLLMLEKVYELSKRYSKIFSIIYLDINELKTTNDTYGHQYGDSLIKSTAEIIDNILRRSDILIRLGGDEFLLVLPNTNLEQSKKVTNRIQDEIDAYNKSERKPFKLSISTGQAMYDKDCNLTLNELIDKADSLMYKDKQNYKLTKKNTGGNL